jgi:hypothetical protein
MRSRYSIPNNNKKHKKNLRAACGIPEISAAVF